MKTTRPVRRAAVVAVIGSLAIACRRGDTGASSSNAPVPSLGATPEPPPLDTNWRKDPGHLLAPGDRAPDFEGIGHTGMRVKLSEWLGKPVVVYFCSSDASPEGMAEARGFREDWMRMNEKVGTVLGVSGDDRATHYDFATAERLPFLLVADEEHHIARAFGALADQNRIQNVVFIVGADGKIARVLSEAAPEGHAPAVITALESP